MKAITSPQFLGICALMLAMLGLTGCGTGEYEERFAKTRGRLATAALFQNLEKETTELLGTPITFRFTPDLENNLRYQESQATTFPGWPSQVARPYFLPAAPGPTGLERWNLSGIQMTCGIIGAAGDGKQQAGYCHIALYCQFPGGDGPTKFQNAFRSTVATFYNKSATVGAWEPMQVNTPNGTQQNWAKLTVQALQIFDGGQQEVAGTLDFYLLQNEQINFIVGIRVPESLASKRTPAHFDRMLGTVQANQLSKWTINSDQLGTEKQFGGFRVRLPNNFVPASVVNGLSQDFPTQQWFSTNANAPAGAPRLVGLVRTKLQHNTKEMFCVESCLRLAMEKEGIQQLPKTPFEYGLIGDQPAVRIHFEGKSQSFPQAVKGFLYATRFDDTVAIVYGGAPANLPAPQHQTLEAAAVSLSQ